MVSSTAACANRAPTIPMPTNALINKDAVTTRPSGNGAWLLLASGTAAVSRQHRDTAGNNSGDVSEERPVEPSAQERAFGAEVKRYQATARVSQDWVAKQVGLSRPKVSEICAGRYLPNRQTLDALITT